MVAVVAGAAVAVAAAATAVVAVAAPQRPAAAARATVDTACLTTMRCSASRDVSWPTSGGTLDNERYSPLRQINRANVKRLKVAWQFRTSVLGSEDYPQIVGNTAYVTTSYGNVYALNATTGEKLWSWQAFKQTNIGLAAFAGVHGFPNRGVAVGGGHVFGVTPNAVLVSLNQDTGRVEWRRSLGNPHWLSESAAPVYYNNMVFVGSAGSESGARGFEAAYNATTGKLIWQHYTVPPFGSGWVTQHHGGGDVWMQPAIDTKRGLLFIGTGNPGEDAYGGHRPGPNKWTNSILALRIKDGKQVWGFQQAPHDLWDFDSVSPPTLFPTAGGMAVGEADKGGVWSEVSELTGTLLGTQTAFVYEHHPEPIPGGPAVIDWPGFTGGSEWSPVPFDRQTHYLYVSGVNAPNKVQVPASQAKAKYKIGADAGGSIQSTGPWLKKIPKALHGTGTFTAIDGDSGGIVWQKQEPTAMIGGSTTSAGGLVFVGVSGKGLFQALDAKTGKVLWQHALHGRIDDAASIYSVNGKEYVLIASGGTSIGGPGWGGMEAPSHATFTAFALS